MYLIVYYREVFYGLQKNQVCGFHQTDEKRNGRTEEDGSFENEKTNEE